LKDLFPSLCGTLAKPSPPWAQFPPLSNEGAVK
jgi:hypothetical protein